MIGRWNIKNSRIAFLCTYLIVSILAGYFLGEPLRLAEKPSEYIGLLFSILAATIFAVVSIVGDPSMLMSGNRRVAWENAISIQRQIQRLNVLFSLHILTLTLLIGTELVEAMRWCSFYWLFNVLAGVTVFSLFLSLRLPFELGKIQRDRLRQEVEKRKSE